MGKTAVWERGLLQLLFNNTAFDGVGDGTGILGSVTAGDLFVSLHTGDPKEAGDQTTAETTYGGYERVPVPRSGLGWTVSGNSVSPFATIQFPACVSDPATITHVGIGTDPTGTGKLLYFGPVQPNILVDIGVAPQLSPASIITEV